jgi:hypothetical protein
MLRVTSALLKGLIAGERLPPRGQLFVAFISCTVGFAAAWSLRSDLAAGIIGWSAFALGKFRRL